MKKEVVHVPTRELAEEVLRVAKENGLYEFTTSLDEMIRDSGFLLDISFESEIYCELSEYQKNHCKIITAQEFLDRYKPKFRPIAMRCTQEQFDAVRSKLVGLKVRNLSAFGNCPYLVNNLEGEKGIISNILNLHKSRCNRQVFEEWNEKTFLEYCGIQVKDEVSELDQLRRENAELKQQLKAIEYQPKVGDVCLFWEPHCKWSVLGVLDRISINGGNKGYYSEDIEYEYCVKATDENIQAKIKELQDDTKTT